MSISNSTNKKILHEVVNNKNSIQLSTEVRDSFKIMLKQGIYKELHNKKLLTDEQLNSLLSK